ncbi:MAG: hypothetical protein V4578_08675, partial [Pseudomonadota bacterium]
MEDGDLPYSPKRVAKFVSKLLLAFLGRMICSQLYLQRRFCASLERHLRKAAQLAAVQLVH